MRLSVAPHPGQQLVLSVFNFSYFYGWCRSAGNTDSILFMLTQSPPSGLHVPGHVEVNVCTDPECREACSEGATLITSADTDTQMVPL